MSLTDNEQTLDEMPPETNIGLQSWASCHPRFIWTLCVIASLLSSRYLLVESNFHYPTLLYLAQLLVATAILVFHAPRWEVQHDGKQNRQRMGAIHAPTLLIFGSMCFTATSMLCVWQAVLHFTNLPVLVMLIVSFSQWLGRNVTDLLRR